ncbi:MAG TPA: ACT domain-containing protein, partial [Desulfobacterales bacterium]|nr:ACT domain-containing protein [Desulfobacterales bacterium]
EVEDRPGGLHRILQLLHEGQINVEYMYAFVQQSGNNAVMIFRFDQTEKAVALLRQNGVTVIDDDRIYKL